MARTKDDGGSRRHQVELKGKPSCLSTESYGLCLIATSALLYSGMGGFVKLATQTGIPATEMVFLRAIFQGSLVVAAMIWFRESARNNDPPLSNTAPKARRLIMVPLGAASMRSVVIARGAVGGCGFVLYFYTISVLPLGDAVSLLSLSPVVTVWASSAIFGEPLRPLHILAAITTVVGSFFIARPTFLFGVDPNAAPKLATYNPLGYVTASLGTCTGAGVFLLMRKAGRSGAHTLQLLFSWVVFGTLFSFVLGVVIPLGNGDWYIPTSKLTWAYILGGCSLGTVAHFLLNFAARHSNPGLASIARSSGIIWAYLLQILLFDQTPTLLTCTGVLLVSTSLILVAIQKSLDAGDKEERTKSCEEEEEKGLIHAARVSAAESMEMRVLAS